MEKRIYFYLIKANENDASKAMYKPQLLSLAEGLKQKNIPFVSNINWWKQSTNEYLFKKTLESIEKFDIIVVGSEIYSSNTKLPDVLTSKSKKRVVMYDWVASVFFSKLVQKKICNFHTYFYYSYSQNIKECVQNNNVLPWPIGLTNRIIEYTQKFIKPFKERTNFVFWAHRNGHPIRTHVLNNLYKVFVPNYTLYNDKFCGVASEKTSTYDKVLWTQTGRRHNPNYYKELCNSQIVDCCGGFLYGDGSLKKDNVKLRNWDNYKIWEAFAAGACVITLDLDYYGFKLPIMPISGVHYIGIRLDDLDSVGEKLKNKEFDFETIANNGKEWVLKNYSPESTAQHFLETLNK